MLANRQGKGVPRYAVGLYRVSTAEQGHSGLGLEAQRASVQAFVAAQGWTLVAEYSDVASGKDDRRPDFQATLTRCRQLGAVPAVARLDRITRRVTRRRRRGARWPSGRRTSCSSTWSGCALRASRASGTGAGSQRARRADAARSRCLDAHDGSEPEGAIE